MPTLEIFAPTWCPAAYVEHEDEPEACRFAADVDWLTAHGVPVVRATLTDEPGRFVEHDAVRFLMNVLGPAVLPVVLVDGLMRSHGAYPSREQLAAWAGVEDLLALERAETSLAHDGVPHDAPTDELPRAELPRAQLPLAAAGHVEEEIDDGVLVDAAEILRRFVPEPAVPFVVGSPAAAAATTPEVPAVTLRAG